MYMYIRYDATTCIHMLAREFRVTREFAPSTTLTRHTHSRAHEQYEALKAHVSTTLRIGIVRCLCEQVLIELHQICTLHVHVHTVRCNKTCAD